MEIVVMIIMVMVGFSFMLKLTFHGLAGQIALAAVAAAFVALSYDYAAGQSRTAIAEWLSQPGLMLDASVWLTIDVALQIAFCTLEGKALNEPLGRVGGLMRGVLLWLPGLAVFPALFALLTELIFSFAGMDFVMIALTTAAVVLIGMPMLAWLMKYLIPESDIRLEMIFMVNLIVICLGIVATVNGRTAAAGTSAIEWSALAVVLAILLAGAAAGIPLYRIITNKKIQR